MKKTLLFTATAALIISAISCGQNRKTAETAVAPPDFSTEKSIITYLTGTWIFMNTQCSSEYVGCKMDIDADLKVSLSFYQSVTKEDKGTYRGRITFDRFYADTGEAPDLLRIVPEGAGMPGGDFFFRHETVYDGKQVMSLCFPANGEAIFHIMEMTGLNSGRTFIFEKEAGGQSQQPQPRKNSEFYAVYWGGDRDFIWLDDVVPDAGQVADAAWCYPSTMSCYKNDVKQSVLYTVLPHATQDIVRNEGLIPGRLYAIQTDRQGQIVSIGNIKPHTDPLLEAALEAAFLVSVFAEYEYHESWIYLKYNQPVNGYSVEAVFAPEEILYDYKMTGTATLRFINQTTGEERQITYYGFALSWQQFPDEFENHAHFYSLAENDGIKSFAKGQTYLFESDEDTNDERELLHPLYNGERPFFFADLNFDGKKELVLTRFGQGQRGCSSYWVYSVDPVSGKFTMLFEAPFDRLDDFSTIDSKNRQIIIQSNNSADDTSEEVYQPDKNGNFYLFDTR